MLKKGKNKENMDPDFLPGKTRRSGEYKPKLDDRGIMKQLMRLKGMFGEVGVWKGMEHIFFYQPVKYQPSGAGDTPSLPATSHCLEYPTSC